MNQWANDWVKYHTGGQGNYVTTGMEDTGTLQSLTFLAKAGRADVNRVLVLRTASDLRFAHRIDDRRREPGAQRARRVDWLPAFSRSRLARGTCSRG